MGDVISSKLLGSFDDGGGGAAGVETAATGPGAGAGSATGAAVAITGWKSVPFLRVILKPPSPS
jgi:hypothetical protein